MANGWGIYDLSGNLVFDVDSVVDLKFSGKAKVSDFPVEKGSFSSYDKVIDPFTVPVRLAVSDSARSAIFMTTLAQELAQANLYNIVTPMNTYLNVTLEGYDFAQAAENGCITGILVDLKFRQIRQVTPAYTTVALPAKKCKNPTSASSQTNGKVQAQPYSNVVSRAEND